MKLKNKAANSSIYMISFKKIEIQSSKLKIRNWNWQWSKQIEHFHINLQQKIETENEKWSSRIEHRLYDFVKKFEIQTSKLKVRQWNWKQAANSSIDYMLRLKIRNSIFEIKDSSMNLKNKAANSSIYMISFKKSKFKVRN